MMNTIRPYTVVLTGPESTGKTTLAEQLAGYFRGSWIPEYARTYVEKLERSYVFEDVVRIARHQIKQLELYKKKNNRVVFLDTDLVIIKIWLQVLYGNVPVWLNKAIEKRKIDLYLLCYPDIPWKYDPVRENPGPKRETLFVRYEEEIRRQDFPYRIVTGQGKERLYKAIAEVEEMLNIH